MTAPILDHLYNHQITRGSNPHWPEKFSDMRACHRARHESHAGAQFGVGQLGLSIEVQYWFTLGRFEKAPILPILRRRWGLPT